MASDLEQFSKAELISIILEIRRELAEVKGELYETKQELAQTKAELAIANAKLAKYERPKKNSRNSSLPPSHEFSPLKRTESLRESGKKNGGQFGHKGNTLYPSPNPEEVIDYHPNYCNGCGADLSGVALGLVESRQVVEIPPVSPTYTEHRCYAKTCACGHQTRGSFPEGVNNRIQYGPRVTAMVAYLWVRQYVPFNRIRELTLAFCGLKISEGGIERLIQRFKNKCEPVYEQIKVEIEHSKVVGTDETGARVNGETRWLWTWQNPQNTFISASPSRGYDTILANFPVGLHKAVLVSDCWAAQLKTPAKTHQLCIAHLRRNLKFLIQLTGRRWAKRFTAMLHDALELKSRLEWEDYHNPIPERDALEAKLDKLLTQNLSKQNKELQTFQKRMIKYRDYLFPFLFFHEVPPDNNASERAIRNVKVKMKVSGQFRSENGIENFAVIRSVIDTLIKRGKNIVEAMTQIATLGECR
jgi:transposase